LARFENIDDVWAVAGAASKSAHATLNAIRDEDTVASSVVWVCLCDYDRAGLSERRGAAPCGAVGFRVPTLLGGDREECFMGSGGNLVIQRGTHDRRRVRGGAKGAIVSLECVVVLVGRDEEERAREVQEDQPAEERVRATKLVQCVRHTPPRSLVLTSSHVNPESGRKFPSRWEAGT